MLYNVNIAKRRMNAAARRGNENDEITGIYRITGGFGPSSSFYRIFTGSRTDYI